MSHSRPTRQTLSATLLGVASLILLTTGAAGAAVTKPYVKVFGGDVFSGGGFYTNASGTSCAYYQYSAPGSGNKLGGILSYAKENSGNAAGGSSGSYGVFAVGPVEGGVANNFGFYSSGALGGAAKNKTTFGNNVNAPNWGGYYDGSVQQTNCVQDYYDAKITGSPAAFPGFSGGLASGQYSLSGGNPTVLAGGKLFADQKITIFVNGQVYISGDITYQNGSDDSVPKFALVVKGNIYISKDVRQLDGLYIAQPTNASSNDGILWTCHDNSNDPKPLAPWFNQNCASKLTINGAVVARQVNLMREQGDVSSATAAEGPGSGNVAEEINYTPAMIMDGGFFNSSNTTYEVQSIINLPPVF